MPCNRASARGLPYRGRQLSGSFSAPMEGSWRCSAGPGARFLDATSGEEVFPIYQPTNAIAYIAYSPDGRRLAAAHPSGPRTGEGYDIRREVPLPKDARADGFAFSPDGRRLTAVSRDGTARVWDVTSRQAAVTLFEDAGPVEYVAFSPDGRYLATVTRKEKRETLFEVWGHSVSGEVILGDDEPNQSLVSVAFSADGRYLATAAGNKGTVVVRKVIDGKEVARMDETDQINAITLSPDGTRLVTASSEQPAMCGKSHSLIRPDSAYLEGIPGQSPMSPSAPMEGDIVTASTDGTVRVWDDAQLTAPATAITSAQMAGVSPRPVETELWKSRITALAVWCIPCL